MAATRRISYCMVLYLSISIALLTAMQSLSEALPITATATDTVSELTRRSAKATVKEGLTQGPYVAARAGFEPTTIR